MKYARRRIKTSFMQKVDTIWWWSARIQTGGFASRHSQRAPSPSSIKKIWTQPLCGRSSRTRSGSNQEEQVVDVCPRGAGLKKIAKFVEKRIRIIAGQVVCRVQPKRLRSPGGFSGHNCTRGIRRTIIAVRPKGNQHYIL